MTLVTSDIAGRTGYFPLSGITRVVRNKPSETLARRTTRIEMRCENADKNRIAITL
jgi:hypothetical protein